MTNGRYLPPILIQSASSHINKSTSNCIKRILQQEQLLFTRKKQIFLLSSATGLEFRIHLEFYVS